MQLLDELIAASKEYSRLQGKGLIGLGYQDGHIHVTEDLFESIPGGVEVGYRGNRYENIYEYSKIYKGMKFFIVSNRKRGDTCEKMDSSISIPQTKSQTG
jgi:hypothetical protein